MKRVLAVFVAVLTVLALAVTSFAAPSPVPPTEDPVITTKPNVLAATSNNPDWSGIIVTTKYVDKDTISPEAKAELEEAYNLVKDAPDLGAISASLKEQAFISGLDSKTLDIAQIFDISAITTGGFEYGKLTITLHVEKIEEFFCVMHYKQDNWHYVPSEVYENEVTFTVDSLSPFMIVRHNGYTDESITTTPELVSAMSDTAACVGEVKLCSYVERITLDDASEAKMVEAYKSIRNAKSILSLNADLKKLVNSLDISEKKLAVSSIFDISCYDCQKHDKHGGFTVTLKPDKANNFVGIMHYVDGKWQLLDVEKKNGEITFYVEELSPFVVINNDAKVELPVGAETVITISIGAATVVAAAVVTTVVVVKKRKSGLI